MPNPFLKNSRKFYDCSTAHLPFETVKKMDSDQWRGVSMKNEFGFLVWVPDSMDGIAELVEHGIDCPAYLKVIQLAQDAGCAYVLFDRDVEPVPYLEVFDW